MKLKLLPIFFLTFALGFVFYYFFSAHHLSDESMETFFLENEEDFEELQLMFGEDKNCLTIGVYGNQPIIDYSKKEPRADCTISAEKQDKYLRLFKKLNIHALIHRDFYKRDVLVFTISFENGETHINGENENTAKGYAFTVNPPFDVVDSLDNIKNEDISNQQRKYKKLKGNWYLFYEKGLSKPE